MDFPSTLLRALGIFLILVGLSGTLGGIYALIKVQEYDFGAVMPEKVGDSLSNMTVRLEENKAGVESSIMDTGISLTNASQYVTSAGDRVNSASQKIDASSTSLTGAANDLMSASSQDRDAAVYLRDASNGLTSWADTYSSNGTTLPDKSTFKSAVDKIRIASDKIEASGNSLEATSKKLQSTATNLKETSVELKSSADNLRTTGENLGNSSVNLIRLKNPLEGMIEDISTPLKELEGNIQAIADVSYNIKTVAYVLIGYLILLHLTLLGIGIAFWIIEANLFYPIS